MTKAELYQALVDLCQQYGFTTEHTYELLHSAVKSIAVEDDEEKKVDPDFWAETTPEMQEGYRIAREMYGDEYADYLITTDEEHWKYALDCGLEFEPDPWPISLVGNDGE